VGVGNGRGGSLATLLLGIAPTATMLGGVNLNVALTGQEILVPAALGGGAGVAGAGFGTLRVALPADAGLAGISLYTQWFVWDGGVAAGAATSRGAEIRFF
ncbi:MAG TPA: hypothetical protein VFZ65_16610, partial [Planctomycetota bacterium]|nr:hypothetical protein [Planctomycetota bacterium]